MGFTKAIKGLRNLESGRPMPSKWKPKNKKKTPWQKKKVRRKIAKQSRRRNRK